MGTMTPRIVKTRLSTSSVDRASLLPRMRDHVASFTMILVNHPRLHFKNLFCARVEPSDFRERVMLLNNNI